MRPPLPQRNGLDPVRVRTPSRGRWPTVRDYLVERFPTVGSRRIDEMFHAQRFIGMEGPLEACSPFVPNSFVWFHRDLPPEIPVPFETSIVHHDDFVLVVDKPHGLATTPRGRHIAETALVRLRRELDLPDLTPAHRLDRPTAGLLVFTLRPEHRGAYQSLFQNRMVHKEYEAIAPHRPDLPLPTTVRSRIVKRRGQITAQERPGEPNAETHVELAEHRDGLGRYRLVPSTGRTHQLRLHLSRLGIPILGDDFYPVLTDKQPDDFSRPLQLLANVLAFTDPLTGEHRRFESRLRLQAWTDFEAWNNGRDT